MPTKPENRNYRAEAAAETPARKAARNQRKRDRYHYEQEHGPIPAGKQLDHRKPLSQGGGSDDRNLRLLPKSRNEAFKRTGPGGKQRGEA